MSKSLEELKDLFSNFDGNLQAEFIEQFPEIWDDCYDIEMGSRYHRLMTSCMLAGWFSAIKAVSEREKKLLNALLSYQGQVLRVYGDKIPDAFKIPYSFAEEALKDYRGMKNGKIE